MSTPIQWALLSQNLMAYTYVQPVPSCEMAKLRSARVTTEVAPPRFVSVTRCRVKKMLDTIMEEENDFVADKRFSSPSCGSSSISLIERPVLLKNC
ncbi:hypothetical protein VNO78_13370 [Psophocarpus tetragonolobus]|uniref:Uncharacterized protein n=1 Tax=Psophocarpus tetragonolobus TaxID=3891 RepID=A0AAN9XQ37_PSOTE